jgi:ketosteroid isomerase-like protein
VTVAVEELVAAFDAHDPDRIMALFADDCVPEMPRGPLPCGGRFVGTAAVREGFAGLPDVRFANHSSWCAATRASADQP